MMVFSIIFILFYFILFSYFVFILGQPCFLNEYLSIGSIGAAYNLSSLLSHNITHILCLSSLCRIKYPQQFIYLKIPIKDNSETNIFEILEPCFEFIQFARQSNGRILIHCFQGISRSATILCAYLMKYSNMTLEQSLQSIRDVRSIISPNPYFLLNLKKYERELEISKESSLLVNEREISSELNK